WTSWPRPWTGNTWRPARTPAASSTHSAATTSTDRSRLGGEHAAHRPLESQPGRRVRRPPRRQQERARKLHQAVAHEGAGGAVGPAPEPGRQVADERVELATQRGQLVALLCGEVRAGQLVGADR